MVNVEHPAFHNDAAGVQIQFFHRRWIPTEKFTENHIRLGGRLGLGSLNRGSDMLIRRSGSTNFLRSVEQLLTFQIAACFKANRHLNAETLKKRTLHSRGTFFQRLFAVGRKYNRQLCPLPIPLGTGQTAPVHGVLSNEQLHKLLVLY